MIAVAQTFSVSESAASTPDFLDLLPQIRRLLVTRSKPRSERGSDPRGRGHRVHVVRPPDPQRSRRAGLRRPDGKVRRPPCPQRADLRIAIERARSEVVISSQPYCGHKPTADVAERRAAWKLRQSGLDPERLAFLDETWVKTIITRPSAFGRAAVVSAAVQPRLQSDRTGLRQIQMARPQRRRKNRRRTLAPLRRTRRPLPRTRVPQPLPTLRIPVRLSETYSRCGC